MVVSTLQLPVAASRSSYASRLAYGGASSRSTRYFVPHAAQTQETVETDVKSLRQISDLPVENGLPILGVVLDMLKEDNDWQPLFKKHNSDAVYVNLGPEGWALALHTAEHLHECSVTKASSMYQKLTGAIENLLMPLGRSTTNEENAPMRAAFGQVMSRGNVMKLQLPLMASQFTDTIRKYAASGEEVLWWEASKRLTFPAAARGALGDVLTEKDMEDLFPLSMEVAQGVYHLNFGLKEGIPFSGYWRAMQAQKELLAILKRRIIAVLADREQLEGPDSIVRQILAVLEAAEVQDPTSESRQRDVVDRLAREVVSLMFAGTDTTAYTMCRAMQHLAQHPQWLDALAEEQQRLMHEHGDTLDRKVISRSAVALAVAQEALRVKPLASMVFRITTEDVTIGDIAVPKGTQIAMCLIKATRDSGNGTLGFDPQLWLSDDRTECTPISGRPGFFAFGKGGRSCSGQNLATIELVTYLAVLAREVKGIQMSTEEIERDFLGMHPTGMPLSLTPRSP